MIEDEETWYRIIIIIFNLLSIAGCAMIVWTYYRIPNCNHNPGNIVLRISVLQLVISTLFLISQFYYFQWQGEKAWSFEIQNQPCKWIEVVSGLVKILYGIYNILLAINILLITKSQQELFNIHFCKLEILGIAISFLTELLTNYIYKNDNYVEGVLGSCMVQDSKTFEWVKSSLQFLFLAVQFTIVVDITFNISKLQKRDSSFSTEAIIFQRRYQKGFLKTNLLYCLIFTLTTSLDIFLNIFQNFQHREPKFYRFTQMSLLAQFSLTGFFYLVIRINDRKVKKYLFRQFANHQGNRLTGKLNINCQTDSSSLGESLLSADSKEANDIQSLEITFYHDHKQYSLKQSQNPLQIKHVVEQPDFQIKTLGEFMQILIAINFTMQNQITIHDKREIRHYWFNHIVQTNIQIKQNPGQLENLLNRESTKSKVNNILESSLLKSSIVSTKSVILFNSGISNKTGLELEDFIEMNNDLKQKNDIFTQRAIEIYGNSTKVICFSYAQDMFNKLQNENFHFQSGDLKQSLNICNNINRLQEIVEFSEINRFGTIYITQDGLISIDLISTAQKARLIHGGGLLKLFRGWKESLAISPDSILPPVIGLHSILIEKRRCINILVKLNSIKVNFPLYQKMWENQRWQSMFLAKNIIGWVTINPNEVINQFLANSVIDGKFSIKLNESDFKIQGDGQIKLIEMLQRDIPMLADFSHNYEINFVYFKFSSKRLQSIYQHEIKNEHEKDILRHASSEADLQNSEGIKKRNYIAKYPLASKIGYVKVFLNELWSSNTVVNEEENKSNLEFLIARVNDFI